VKLPYGRQSVGPDDLEAVIKVLESDFLTTGPVVEDFESRLAEYVGSTHAISCSSGTAALHLAALALGLGPGDQVIVPTVTFLATANAVRYVGAEVVFADVDSQTGQMGLEQFIEAFEKCDHPAAVFPVHLGGASEQVSLVKRAARERGLLVIEDACHALGGALSDEGSPIGGCEFSDMTVFSFHPVKTITMGEGGAVTTNDPTYATRLARLRNSGMSKEPENIVNRELAFNNVGDLNPWYYEMSELGLNYRASAIHCALGLSQLTKLEQFVARREDIVCKYDDLLQDALPGLRPVPRAKTDRESMHLYRVLIDFEEVKTERSLLMEGLARRGIGTQVHYIPVHLQPYYRSRYGVQDLPGSLEYYLACLSLPLFAEMTVKDAEYVVSSILDEFRIA